MKEKIYTITLNEAFEADSECPFCFLHKELEKENVEYALGAAMMEPDFRILSNERGFCRQHYSMMFEKQNKLSLSLLLETHLYEFTGKFKDLSSELKRCEKRSFIKKSDAISNFDKMLSEKEVTCVICEKTEATMKRYEEVFFYLWKNEELFREKVKKSKGVCIPHFRTLFLSAFKYLPKNEAKDFVSFLYEKEISALDRLQDEIHRFTLKFDYRNKDMEIGSAIDAPLRTIEKIAGYMHQNKQE